MPVVGPGGYYVASILGANDPGEKLYLKK